MGTLNRCDTPPPAGPRYPVRRLKANERFTFVLLSNLQGCYTHWDGRRSQPCQGTVRDDGTIDGRHCPSHKNGYPLRWKGYIHVWNVEAQQEEFLEVTPVMAKLIRDHLGGPKAMFRGNRLLLSRGNGHKSRLRVEILAHYGQFANADPLPNQKDPFDTLKKLWGIPDLAIDTEPPILPMSEAG